MAYKIVLRRFDDMHCHFRYWPLLPQVLPCTLMYANRAVAMPNLKSRPILNAANAEWYHSEIKMVCKCAPNGHLFEPLMTIEIRDNTTPQMIEDARRVGVVAGKVYPLGVTTNSDKGLRDFFSHGILETFSAMQDTGMLLLLHGELDEERTLVIKREEAFLPTLIRLASMFPKLKIVLEHVSTEVGVDTVKRLLGANVAATITAHHLCLTLNDVIGYGIQPHHACMPMPKDFSDRDALIKAATSGSPKFFLGSDTAPHHQEEKECALGKCGVFTAPILPCLLAEIFEKAGRLEQLEDFTSKFGAEFYGLPLNKEKITLVKEPWTAPLKCGAVVPFRAGTEISWKLVS